MPCDRMLARRFFQKTDYGLRLGHRRSLPRKQSDAVRKQLASMAFQSASASRRLNSRSQSISQLRTAAFAAIRPVGVLGYTSTKCSSFFTNSRTCRSLALLSSMAVSLCVNIDRRRYRLQRQVTGSRRPLSVLAHGRRHGFGRVGSAASLLLAGRK